MTETHEPEAVDPVLPLDPARLEWPTDTPPAGFADAVVDAFLGEDGAASGSGPERGHRPPPGRVRWQVPALVVVAAALALWLGSRLLDRPVRGELQAEGIATTSIGDRAVAVARPGARLTWDGTRRGGVRVSQASGRVFYRVEPGETFRVHTPNGSVRVTGTCFEVEITDMNVNTKDMKIATAGAALATMVVVTVYEGGVVFANGGEELALRAGDRGHAAGAGAPRRGTGNVGTGDGVDDGALAALVKSQAREIAALRAQVETGAEAGSEGADGSGDGTERIEDPEVCALAARDDGEACSFLEPTPETLQQMARCGAVRADIPGYLDDLAPPRNIDRLARLLGVEDPDEKERILAAAQAHYDEFNRDLRAIYVELGGDVDLAQDAPPEAVQSLVLDFFDDDMMGTVARQIAQERAGLADPPDPTEWSLEQRTMRLLSEVGNRFEHHLTRELGPERARELRRQNDGWPLSARVVSGTCRDDGE